MSDRLDRPPARFAWLYVVAAVLLVPAIYVGGYFAVGRMQKFDTPSGIIVGRVFPSRTIMMLYRPMLRLESHVRG